MKFWQFYTVVFFIFLAIPSTVKAQVDNNCVAKYAPKINVAPKTTRVKYNLTKTTEELSKVKLEVDSPYDSHEGYFVNGYMEGSVAVNYKIDFWLDYISMNTGCVSFRSIDVEIILDPIVYITNEFPKGSCSYNAILEHELKHVRADQIVVNKYAELIARALKEMIDQRGSSLGPFPETKMTKVRDNINRSVGEIIDVYRQKIYLESYEMQAAIDTLEEYEAVNKKVTECGNK